MSMRFMAPIWSRRAFFSLIFSWRTWFTFWSSPRGPLCRATAHTRRVSRVDAHGAGDRSGLSVSLSVCLTCCCLLASRLPLAMSIVSLIVCCAHRQAHAPQHHQRCAFGCTSTPHHPCYTHDQARLKALHTVLVPLKPQAQASSPSEDMPKPQQSPAPAATSASSSFSSS